jgi:hypothetical protein
MVVGAALGSRGARAAPSASVSVEMGAGHDDNMFLAATPLAADTLLRLGGWYGAVSPALSGGLGGRRLRLEASFLGDYRAADPVGYLYYQQGQLGLVLALGRLQLQLGGSAGRFDASRYPEDRFYFLGGESGLRLTLGDWQIGGRYRLQARRVGATTTSDDRLQAVEGQLHWRPHPALMVGPTGSFLQVSGGQSQARFQRLRGGLEVAVELGPVQLAADGWGGTVALGTSTERHLGGQLEARWSVNRYLDLVAAFEIAEPISAGATRDYARRVLSLSMAASAGHVWRPAPPPDPVAEVRPLVKPGRVRFRLRAPAAAEVMVVGSWDDWQTPGRALSVAEQPDLYELWVDLPEGSYRYHFLVNGQAHRPPGAPRYAPDGFGGEDGVVELETPLAGSAPVRPSQVGAADVSSGGGGRISTGSER